MKISNKIWLGLIVLLLISNLVLVSFLFWGKNERPKPFLEKQLNFTALQTASYQLLRDQHEHVIRQKLDSTRLLKDQFFKGLSTNASPEEQSALAAQIGALEASRDMATYEHFANVRKLCDSEQKEEFDKLLRELLRPPGPRNGAPPNDRMGPPVREHPEGGIHPGGQRQPPPPPH